MLNEFSRTELLLGSAAMEKLKNSTVAVFGLGGVGSYTVEALVRSGIGGLDLFDNDKVSITNINRQIIATRETVGRPKVEVMRELVFQINPSVNITLHPIFYTAENADTIDYTKYSYIVDAIDTVSSKLTLIEKAKARGVPIISCMGAGNKLDPTKFEVADIFKTSVCPLARVMRTELRKRNIKSLKVVYSKETPIKPIKYQENESENQTVCPQGTKHPVRKQIPGSIAFVPSVAGLILAGEVIKDIIK